ncbi:hypothetical protein LCGC14_0342350 [marine sediment metagenome]|uniref:Uncharacterized protein n=1 Tax=marine sediment metagenome TaxID=412755 RepID=A0A0F9WL16_9ZZZZ
MKEFANGFDSWQRTHYAIARAITLEMLKEHDSPNKLYFILKNQGEEGMYNFAVVLTDEFESVNMPVVSNDEFIDELEIFFQSNI